MSFPRLTSINIKGYRRFRDFTAEVGALEVLVGANGSGKSSLFEFLKFMRDGMLSEIPAGITMSGAGQQVFHRPGADQFEWIINYRLKEKVHFFYHGILAGPLGRISIPLEELTLNGPNESFLMRNNPGPVTENTMKDYYINQLLNPVRFPIVYNMTAEEPHKSMSLFALRSLVGDWRFYNTVTIARDKIKKAVVIEQDPSLNEDCGNLSSVLHYLMTEHQACFNDIQSYLCMIIPGFQTLTVKARGGPGEVIAFWREKGVDTDLSLADLSDGILRLLCWMVLCLHPKPPSLICIDEPDQGVHPRTLPVLAGLLQKASERTQIFIATHSSYFLSQFNLSEVAVMKKENGEAVFRKPKDSKVIESMLEDFGTDEIGYLHWSDQLETFS